MVYVGGTFDLFHEGHEELLDVAAKIAGDEGQVIVAVNSDRFVERHKNVVPALNEVERVKDVELYMAYLGGVYGCTSEVIILNNDNEQKKNLSFYVPDFMLHGGDWTGEKVCERYGVTSDWLHTLGITLIYKDRVPDISSTELRKELE